ncbi:PH domain-containing protein [Amphibacillus sp. Q70]|uniref:PH domain-containing protein n=1 Tax=Amphibacillus sp. Q70 TaxID=3453416 RepID=UPI003F85D6A9
MSEEVILLEFETDLYGIQDNSDGVFKIPREYYTLTNERLKVRKQGLVTKTLNDIEIFKVKDVIVKQTLIDKARGVGDIGVVSSDISDPVLKLKKVKDPYEVREQIRKAVKKARGKLDIYYKEEL